MNKLVDLAADGASGNDPTIDHQLLEMGLRLTPAQRLRWLEETVEELLPWLGLASSQTERKLHRARHSQVSRSRRKHKAYFPLRRVEPNLSPQPAARRKVLYRARRRLSAAIAARLAESRRNNTASQEALALALKVVGGEKLLEAMGALPELRSARLA